MPILIPAYTYLFMPTIYAYLSIPTYLYLPIYAYCLCLPIYTSCICYCLYLPVCNLGERSARSRAPPNAINRLIVLIRMVLYGRSLAVDSNGGRLGCLPRRPWFDSATGRYWSSGPIRSIDRLNHSWRSLDGRSNGGRLVLATVVWFWQRSSDCRSGASLGRKDVRKEG